MTFESSKWIWLAGSGGEKNSVDEYGDFFDSLEYRGGSVSAAVSCDGNYALYINGMLAGFGQYADFPWCKVYDEIEITPYLKQGKNDLRFVVWHYGDDQSSCYYNALPCLRYEIRSGSDALAFSSQKTMCRRAAGYLSGLKKHITNQMGFSFCYDTRDAGALLQSAAVCANMDYALSPRPIKFLGLEPLSPGVLINADKQLYDLGRERCGLLYIRFCAPAGAVVTVSFGEHIVDGGVRRLIADRDFSVQVIGSGKIKEYLNPFRRLACRYLQIDADSPVVIEAIGLRETPYPVTERPFKADTAQRQHIYDTSVRTLHLCMYEHYEDCPWREQAFYVLDSRNQMLFGGAAFSDGQEFQRASLQ
jgi:hypothetical protein